MGDRPAVAMGREAFVPPHREFPQHLCLLGTHCIKVAGPAVYLMQTHTAFMAQFLAVREMMAVWGLHVLQRVGCGGTLDCLLQQLYLCRNIPPTPAYL